MSGCQGTEKGRGRRRAPLVAVAVFLAAVGTSHASHLPGFPDTEGHTTLNQILTPTEDPVVGYTTLEAEQVSEDYEVRDANEPVPGAPVADADRAERRRSLAYLSQMTDFQLADEESPARVEFLDQGASSAWRPHEAFQPFMVDASVRQINRFADASPVPQGGGSGNAMDLSLITGDQADNMQRNESVWVRELLEGGSQINFNSGLSDPGDYANPAALGASCPLFVTAEDGASNAAAEGAAYTGVQDYDDYPGGIGNAYYYDPDEVQGSWLSDGWPGYSGLLDRAQELSFIPDGLDVPFYVTNGNHDVLVQGNEDANRAFEDIATGCFKALGTTATPPAGVADPNTLLLPTAGGMLIPPDPQRQFASKPQIKEIYGATGAQADEHGFGLVNPAEDAASNGSASYYAWNPPQTPGIRFISIDTNSEGGQTAEGVGSGSSNGNIDDPQFQWLKSELDNAQAEGQLIVLFGHHPVRSMDTLIADEQATPCTPDESPLADDGHGHDTNPGCDPDPRISQPLHLGDEATSPGQTFVDLLNGYPNVIAYVAGHTHDNKLLPFTRSDDTVWWEVNTAATADNPTQSRLVEIMDNRDRTLSIFGTVLNHASDATAPGAGPAGGFNKNQLASIGRTFAWNDPQGGSPSGEGTELDQNAELLVKDPRMADLAVSKLDSPDPVEVDGVLTYTLTVDNLGPSIATGAELTDQLPAGVDFLSASAPGGSCSESGGTVDCELGDITDGGSRTVTIRVRPQSTGSITNQVSVEGILPDETPGNNSDTAQTTVTDVTCGGEAATIVGTPGDDQGAGALIGTSGRDVMNGRDGDDLMRGRPGADCVEGAGGNDEPHGGRGPDELRGGPGDDAIFPGRGFDQILAGDGNDEIFAVGNKQDTIACGPGIDRVHAGVNDNVAGDCEIVTRGS